MKIVTLTDESGFWTATLDVDGIAYAVDRRFGSWQMAVAETPTQRAHRKFVLPEVAAALQARVRREERSRARAAK